MRPFIRTIETLELDGGILCLDFVNTVRNRFEYPLFDFIAVPEDLLLWICRTQICDDITENRLKKYILKNQEKAKRDLKKILRIRELLYRIFHQLSHAKKPSDEDIRHFNKELSLVFRYLNFEIDEKLETKIIWNHEPSDLLWALMPIISSASELLISDSKDRIKECPNCGWLFLDKSKNKSRAWCNMKTCGNTIKIKKYYEKNKKKTKSDNQ
jgi:predicted RNA-binding Zn ribbon-like protein